MFVLQGSKAHFLVAVKSCGLEEQASGQQLLILPSGGAGTSAGAGAAAGPWWEHSRAPEAFGPSSTSH